MLYKRIRWLTAVVLASASFTAFGQAYPAKPVRIMVGANAGGATPAHGTAYDPAGTRGLASFRAGTSPSPRTKAAAAPSWPARKRTHSG